MNEDQAERMIELLEELNSKLDTTNRWFEHIDSKIPSSSIDLNTISSEINDVRIAIENMG